MQVGVVADRLDVTMAVGGVTPDEAWPARHVVELDGVRMPVLSIEHLLQNKRTVGRPKDILDAQILERNLARRRRS